MANVHLHIPSFNAGELSPLLGARFAVEKVAAGCRRLRNFLIHVHGPAFRRPGMEHMGASMGSGAKSRLQGFNFSTTTGFMLEFHPNGLQVWSNGVRVPLRNPLALPYTEQECAELQMAQVNDVCYIAHPNHIPRKLIRYADDDWRLEEIIWKWPALGDENVRPQEIASPAVTLRFQAATYEWPEWKMTGGYVFDVTNPDLSSAEKTARIQQKDGEKWETRRTLKWTTTPPDPETGNVNHKGIWRMTYNGPITTDGQLSINWDGEGLNLNGTLYMDISVALPRIETPVNVPAGEWQTTVICEQTLPNGGALKLQKLAKTGTWKDFQELKLKPGQIIVTRLPTLTEAGTFRFVWSGRAMMGGSAKIESIAFPKSQDVTVEVDAINGENRTMTASSPLFHPGHIGTFWQIVHRRDSAFAQIVAGEPTITPEESDAIRVAGHWDVFSYGTWKATLFLEKKVSSTWEVVRSWSGRKDRNIIASGEEEQEVEMRLRITEGTSEAATGAEVPRFVLEAADARVYGLVQIKSLGPLDVTGKAQTAVVDIITTLHSTAPTALWTEGAWSGVRGYPRTVALHGQRLWFGGTRSEPLRLWGSVVGDYEDFRRSSLDDAGVSFTPAAQQSNTLQWMVSHGEDLILGTVGDEWTLSGGGDGPITPTSVKLQRRSGYGSQYLPALLLGEVVVFVQRGARKLRQVAPRADGVVWSAADLTVLAEHVARAGVTQFAVMNFPYSILWAVTADGRLLGMTFEQEQNVFGWHVHDTDGAVESVGVVYGVESDEVWLQVRRNGVRSIERLDPEVFARNFHTRERLIYLDASKRFESAVAFDTVTGLEHLEGREIAVLGDGAELAPARVLDGTAKLEMAVRTAIVGLPFTSELQPMRLEIPMRDGTSQHRPWKISRVGMFLHESLGGEVASYPEGRFEKLNYRTAAMAMDSAPPLHNGEVETAVEGGARNGADVIVRQSSPLPLNIGSLTLKGDLYGD